MSNVICMFTRQPYVSNRGCKGCRWLQKSPFPNLPEMDRMFEVCHNPIYQLDDEALIAFVSRGLPQLCGPNAEGYEPDE